MSQSHEGGRFCHRAELRAHDASSWGDEKPFRGATHDGH